MEESDGPGKGRTRLILAIAILLVAVAGVAAALVLTKDKDDKKSDEVATADAGSSKSTTTTVEDAPEKTTTEKQTTTTTQPAEVPELVGLTVEQARAKVSDLGITLKAVNVVNEEKASGTIVAQVPAAGAAFEKSVVINVARPAVKTYLASLTPVEGQTPSTDPMTLDAVTYSHATTFDACEYSFNTDSNRGTAGYDLGRRYTRFVAKVGAPDDASSGTQIKFEVQGDGRPLADSTAGLGEAKDIDVDVTGVLRLSIYVTGINCTGATGGVFADPQLTSPPPADDAAVTTTTEP